MDRVKSPSSRPWHANGGVRSWDQQRSWGGGRVGGRVGGPYNGLARTREEEEAIIGGPPGFLDEQDDDENENVGEREGSRSDPRPTGMDADGVIRI